MIVTAEEREGINRLFRGGVDRWKASRREFTVRTVWPSPNEASRSLGHRMYCCEEAGGGFRVAGAFSEDANTFF